MKSIVGQTMLTPTLCHRLKFLICDLNPFGTDHDLALSILINYVLRHPDLQDAGGLGVQIHTVAWFRNIIHCMPFRWNTFGRRFLFRKQFGNWRPNVFKISRIAIKWKPGFKNIFTDISVIVSPREHLLHERGDGLEFLQFVLERFVVGFDV